MLVIRASRIIDHSRCAVYFFDCSIILLFKWRSMSMILFVENLLRLLFEQSLFFNKSIIICAYAVFSLLGKYRIWSLSLSFYSLFKSLNPPAPEILSYFGTTSPPSFPFIFLEVCEPIRLLFVGRSSVEVNFRIRNKICVRKRPKTLFSGTLRNYSKIVILGSNTGKLLFMVWAFLKFYMLPMAHI